MAEKNIIKIKTNIIDGYRKFNELLTKKNLDLDDLKYVLQKYNLKEIILKRLITFVYKYPNIIIYLNKYLNQ